MLLIKAFKINLKQLKFVRKTTLKLSIFLSKIIMSNVDYKGERGLFVLERVVDKP